MAIGRILGKTLKKSVSKDKKGTSITSLYEQGKKIQKKKEDIKELKKGAKAVAGAGAAVGAVGVAGNAIEKEKKSNDAVKARKTEKASATPSKTSGSTLKQRQQDAKAVVAGVEAGKQSKAKLDKDIKDARTKRALSDMENAISKASKMTAEEKRKRETTSYKIKSGDTLSAIARANGTTVATLMSLNPSIKDKDKIYAGKSMKLPKK